MLTIRRAKDRGHVNFGWLDSHHTFSFGHYHDPRHMGFRTLRVINDDRVEPGMGFGTHPHRDMEILSYVLEGALEHEDSTGTGSVVRAGDVQRMSAGTGVRHSELNASKSEPVHFLQIWIEPEQRGLPPSYEQKHFAREDKLGKFRLAASHDGRQGSVLLHQDLCLYIGLFEAGESAELTIARDRHAWVHIAKGHARVNGEDVSAGDGVALSDERRLVVEGVESAEVLVFDLA